MPFIHRRKNGTIEFKKQTQYKSRRFPLLFFALIFFMDYTTSFISKAKEPRKWEEVTFYQITDEEYREIIQLIETGIAQEADADSLFTLYEEAYDCIIMKVQNLELMDLQSNLNMNLVFDDYAAENSELSDWEELLCEVMKKMCSQSLYEEACKTYFGMDAYESFLYYEPIPENEKTLLERIDQLLIEADRVKATKTVQISGKDYTLAQLEEAHIVGEITERRYDKAYYELCDSCYEELSGIFVELVNLRNELARTEGYENYMDYAYEVCYQRDYTYEQSNELREYLVEFWMPDYLTYEEEIYQMETELEPEAFSLDGVISIFKKYLPLIDHTFRESIEFAEEYHYWDLEERGEKVSFSFVQDLSYEQVPYLSIHGVENLYDLTVFAHEMGHFNADYHSSEDYWVNMTNIIDIAEIHSQANELLLSFYYYDCTKNAGFSQAYGIMNVEQLILYASLMDGIEYDIYTNGELEAADVNDAYVKWTEVFYGFSLDSDSEYAKSWVLDDIWYSSPCYYQSYVVSGFTALDIFAVATNRYEDGVSLYKEVMESDWQFTYLSLVEELGLLNPFEKADCDDLSEKLREIYGKCLSGYSYDSPYLNLKKISGKIEKK